MYIPSVRNKRISTTISKSQATSECKTFKSKLRGTNTEETTSAHNGKKPQIVYVCVKQKSAERNRKMVCPICGKLVRTNAYKEHEDAHKLYACTMCNEEFKTSDLLQQHQQLHEVNKYPCTDCSLSFVRPIDLASHSRKHSSLRGLQCPFCDFATPFTGRMTKHIRRHENNYHFKCDICGKGFASGNFYKDHMDIHYGIKKFECHICHKKFVCKRYLQVHLKLNHKDIIEGVNEVHQCHICQRTFSMQKSLVRHLSVIHNVGKSTRVACHICNKVVANQHNLNVHLRLHSGERPFMCENCGKGYIHQRALLRHLKSHNKKLK